jgi:hypothetical protein
VDTWCDKIRVFPCRLLKKNSVAFSPQYRYTKWATATSRGILVLTFVDRGVSCSQRGLTPMAMNLSFLDHSRYFFFQVAHLSSWGWVDPVPDPLLLRKSGSRGNRTRDHWVCSLKLWPLDHRDSQPCIYLSGTGKRGRKHNWRSSFLNYVNMPHIIRTSFVIEILFSGIQYIYWRSLRLHHHYAYCSPSSLFPWWHSVPHLPVPEVVSRT